MSEDLSSNDLHVLMNKERCPGRVLDHKSDLEPVLNKHGNGGIRHSKQDARQGGILRHNSYDRTRELCCCQVGETSRN